MESKALRAGDAGYPAAMVELGRVMGGWSAATPTLYLRGALPSFGGVAVVGTRQPTRGALAFTQQLCEALVAMGVAIWSGGARGIDAAAHQAALASGGHTVVVTAGGLDTSYPAEHAALFAQVLRHGGALLSLQADGAVRQRYQFLQRNALLAAFTCATVLVQAPLKSGARSTCAAARRLGRPLLVVPQAPWSTRGAGCALELSRGAFALDSAKQACRIVRAILTGKTTYQRRIDSLEEVGTTQLALPRRREKAAAILPTGIATWPAAQRQVWQQLQLEPAHIDALCEATGLAAAAVGGALLELRLLGVAVAAGPGRYRRA